MISFWPATSDIATDGLPVKGWPGAPGVGEAHPVWRTEEQRRAKLTLQALEPGGQGRLGDEECLGGPADAASSSHLEETLDLDELDATRFPVTGFFYSHSRTLQILSIGLGFWA